MSEKIQRTAASLREKMLHRYDDGCYHKHNKHRLEYRQHSRSHPVGLTKIEDDEISLQGPTGLLREFKLRKTRKRLDKGQIH